MWWEAKTAKKVERKNIIINICGQNYSYYSYLFQRKAIIIIMVISVHNKKRQAI